MSSKISRPFVKWPFLLHLLFKRARPFKGNIIHTHKWLDFGTPMTSPPRSLQARSDQWVEKIGTQSRLILLSLLRRRQANGLDTSISMFFQMSTTSTNAYGNRWEIMWKQVHENDGLVSNIRMSGVFPSAAPCRYEMWQVKRKHLEHTSRTHRNLFLF